MIVAEAVADDAGAGALLGRLVETLDAAGVPYCVLHGHDQYPHRVTSDVDCLMPPEVLPVRLAGVLHAARKALGADILQWVEGASHFIVLVGRAEGGTPYFLQLHVSPGCDLGRRRLFSAGEVLGGRQRRGKFWVPAPDVEFAWSLARRVDKGELREEHTLRLATLFGQDPAGCRRQVERVWGRNYVESICVAAATGDWFGVRREMPRLRDAQRAQAVRRRPLRFVANCFAGAARTVRRACRADSGIDVALLGPDGSGKSTILQAVRADLAPAFAASERRTFPPGLRQRGLVCETNATPHAVPPRSPLASAVRAVGYWLTYYSFGYISRVARRGLARRSLVLHDRHLVDALVDPRRYRYGGPMWLLRLVSRLIPPLDLVVFLDAPVEVVQTRKQEVPPEETARQLRAYRTLVTALPNAHTVDAARPASEVAAAVEDLILSDLSRRAARRFGFAREVA